MQIEVSYNSKNISSYLRDHAVITSPVFTPSYQCFFCFEKLQFPSCVRYLKIPLISAVSSRQIFQLLHLKNMNHNLPCLSCQYLICFLPLFMGRDMWPLILVMSALSCLNLLKIHCCMLGIYYYQAGSCISSLK